MSTGEEAAADIAVHASTVQPPAKVIDPEEVDELDIETIQRRLLLHSPALVDELHKITVAWLEGEERRKAALEGKASSLLSAVGISISLLTALGGTLLTNQQFIAALGSTTLIVSGLLAGSISCGLISAYFALKTLQITKYHAVKSTEVFAESALAPADDHYKLDKADTDKSVMAFYRRYIIIHYLKIYRHNADVNNDKAKRVAIGQKLFFGQLAILLVLAMVVLIAPQWPTRRTPEKAQMTSIQTDPKSAVGLTTSSTRSASSSPSP